MKKLILMRHAKSSWSESDITDIERTLAERGRTGAGLIGAWLTVNDLEPDQAIVSNATRCQETWELASAGMSVKPQVSTEPQLYMATPDRILDIVRKSAVADTVLVLAHQPGIGAFARAMRVDPAPQHAIFDKYPSGATTVLELPIDDWATLDFGMAHLAEYITPKDLG